MKHRFQLLSGLSHALAVASTVIVVDGGVNETRSPIVLEPSSSDPLYHVSRAVKRLEQNMISEPCTWSGSVPGSGSGPKNGTRANSIREVKRRPAGSAGRADRRRRIGPRRRNFQRSKTPTGSPTKCRVHFGMCAWCCEFLTGARACVCARVRVHRWAYVCLCTCTCI